MTLPMFPPGQDPGPNFTRSAPSARSGAVRRERCRSERRGIRSGGVPGAPGPYTQTAPFPVRHGTTICAVRYSDGVLMAGDRRATAGSAIAHRAMEKVHPADTHSGVAIAGAAGPASKWSGSSSCRSGTTKRSRARLSASRAKPTSCPRWYGPTSRWRCRLCGGASLRRLRPTAGQGTGYYTYDPTGGRYEETDFHADGSGGGTPAPPSSWASVRTCPATRGSSFASAPVAGPDENSATGGPEIVRAGISPTVATITARGFERVPEANGRSLRRVIATLSVGGVRPAGWRRRREWRRQCGCRYG